LSLQDSPSTMKKSPRFQGKLKVAGLLAPLGLRLSEEKTRVVDVDEGFVFLGFLIQRRRKRGTTKSYVYTVPSRKAIQSIKDRVSAATYRSTQNQDLDQLLLRLNRMLAGWANYFRHGVSKATFTAIDSHAWSRIAGWLRRKHRIGRSQLRRFCDRDWRFACHGIAFKGAASVQVTLPLPRSEHRDPVDTETDNRQWLTLGIATWRAGCGESRTSGSAGGLGKRVGSNPDTAPQADPTGSGRR